MWMLSLSLLLFNKCKLTFLCKLLVKIHDLMQRSGLLSWSAVDFEVVRCAEAARVQRRTGSLYIM